MTAARQAPTATTAVAPKNVTPRIPVHGAMAQSTPADTPMDAITRSAPGSGGSNTANRAMPTISRATAPRSGTSAIGASR